METHESGDRPTPRDRGNPRGSGEGRREGQSPSTRRIAAARSISSRGPSGTGIGVCRLRRPVSSPASRSAVYVTPVQNWRVGRPPLASILTWPRVTLGLNPSACCLTGRGVLVVTSQRIPTSARSLRGTIRPEASHSRHDCTADQHLLRDEDGMALNQGSEPKTMLLAGRVADYLWSPAGVPHGNSLRTPLRAPSQEWDGSDGRTNRDSSLGRTKVEGAATAAATSHHAPVLILRAQAERVTFVLTFATSQHPAFGDCYYQPHIVCRSALHAPRPERRDALAATILPRIHRSDLTSSIHPRKPNA